MKAWHWRIALLGAVVLGSCLGCGDSMKMGSNSPVETQAEKKAEVAGFPLIVRDDAAEPREKAVEQPADVVVRKISYTATLRLKVDDFPKAEEGLLQLIDEYKGLLEKSEITGVSGTSRSGYWKIRVTPERLAAFRKAVVQLGETEQNNLDSQDMTEEYYDLKVRLKNKEGEVDRFQDLLKKAVTIPDILSVSRELDRTQLELERLKGRQKYLDSITGLATLNVWFQERGVFVPPESPDFGTSVSRTFSNSLNALVQFGRGLALVVVALTPWLPVMLLIALPAYFWRRWHKRERIRHAVVVPGPQSAGPVGDQ